MIVTYAHTEVQEETISGMIQYIYSTIFPRCLTKGEIDTYREFKVLEIDWEYITRERANRIMAALSVISAMIDCYDGENQKGKSSIFQRNVQILEANGLSFPFTWGFFEENLTVSDPQACLV